MDTLHSKDSFVFNIWGFLKPYAQLMRLERPIGTWLCLLPSLWGLALASPNLNIVHIILFFIGATLVRGAGCTINDLIDKNIDKKVIRTKNRPLAAGHISPKQAIIFLGIQLTLAFSILLLFNKMTVFLGLMIALPIGIYPFMKRITFWPQIFLGVVFNWGCLMGWSSVHNSLSLSIVLLYLSCIFWTVGYDTVYAFQDYEDDLAIGMKSSALKIGKQKGKSFVIGCYSLFFAGLISTLFIAHKPLLGASLIPLAVFSFLTIQKLNLTNPDECGRFFQKNKIIGLLIWAGFLISNFVESFL